MKYLVSYRCMEDSQDWGKKGMTNGIVFPEYPTEKEIKSYCPSNWRMEYMTPHEEKSQ